MPNEASGLQTIRTRAVTRRVRIAPSRTWWACLVVVPALLAALATVVSAGSVQDDLRHRVEQQLVGAGWTSVTLDIEGRDVTAHVPATINDRAVAKTIHAVEGVRDVEVTR